MQSGETLSGIATDFNGDPGRFRIIFAANLDDPDVIVPGQELRIPQ